MLVNIIVVFCTVFMVATGIFAMKYVEGSGDTSNQDKAQKASDKGKK